jgi:lysophospholipase L1-like esterase
MVMMNAMLGRRTRTLPDDLQLKQRRQPGIGRHRLRPAVESMECRTLLSTQPLIIAALGDSLTDEYQFYGAATPTAPSYPAILSDQAPSLPPQIYLTGRDAAQNWVEQVGALLSSQLSFGNFTTESRGMTRNQGYQEDWAENGTTASGPDVSGTATTFAEEYNGVPPEFSLGEDPAPGLDTQQDPPDISIGDINVVTILIGANDYNAALSAYTDQTDKLDTSVFDTANTNIENAIATAISTIQSAAAAAGNTSLKFVVITTPDITDAPLIQDEAGAALPALKVIIGEKIAALDLNLASTYHGNSDVGLINSTQILNNFIANPVMDGVTVNMEGAGQNYTDGFTGDGFHPGTIVQGLIAQAVAAEINTLEGSQVVAPVTDAEIVGIAESTQPSITFSSSASTTTVGQGITFTANVIPSATASAFPTGTVTFEQIIPATQSQPAEPGAILGTVLLSATGQATLTVNSLPAGSYSIAAIYNGDPNTDARLSSTLTQTVTTSSAATSTTLYSTPNPISPGDSVTFTAVVSPIGTGLPTATGPVTFFDKATGQIIGMAPLNSLGVATLSVALTGDGEHPIVASYNGTNMLAASASAPLVETIAPSLVTTTQIVARRFAGQGTYWVGLTVIVSPVDAAAGMPTGSVKLSLGTYHVVKLRLNGGTAKMNVRLAAVARHIVSAFYPGNGIVDASSSPFLKLSPSPNGTRSTPAAKSAGGNRAARERRG